MKKIFFLAWYSFWKTLASLGLKFYFSKIQVEGKKNVPTQGPVLLAVNHQNSFLDAIIVACVLKRKTFFLARGDVFRKSWAHSLLSSLGIMPIYRFRDGHGKIRDNEAVFRTCSDILKMEGMVMIFPEGNHYMKWYLRPLQKGIARIAFLSQSDPDAKPITIIPVGLQYEDHTRPASEILVNIGKGLKVKDYFPNGDDPRPALEKLISDLEEKMKLLILNIPEKDYDKWVKKWKAARLRFSDLKKQLSWDQEYIHSLLVGDEVRSTSEQKKRSYSVLPYLLLPVGWFTHIVPRLIISLIVKKTVRDPQFIAPLNFALGMIFYPVNSILWGITVGWCSSNLIFGFLAFLLVLFAGKITIRFWH